MHPLDDSLQLQAVAGDNGTQAVLRARTSERYRNAIGPFGGWTAALLLKAVLGMPEARGAPLSLDAVFMGPIDDGEVEVRVALMRQNRTVGFWRSELWQGARICAHAQVTLSAEVKREKEAAEGERVLHTERSYGKTTRSFTLPAELDEAKVEAKFRDGVLELKLPKKAAAERKSITIQ